jgi:poly(3-hydroxyalkanoate) synthetase
MDIEEAANLEIPKKTIEKTFKLSSLLRKEKTSKTRECFLIIPPLINKIDILDVPDNSFLSVAQHKADAFILKWDTPTTEGINEHVVDCISAIEYLKKIYSDVHLIGYCMGGHLALLAASLSSCKVSCIATPLQFTSDKWKAFSEFMNSHEKTDVVSGALMQMLFYLDNFVQTNEFYISDKKKNLYIEEWLDDYVDISYNLLAEMTEFFVRENVFSKTIFEISGIKYNLHNMDVVKLIYGTHDSVVQVNEYEKHPFPEKISFLNVGHVGLVTSAAKKIIDIIST